MLFWIVFFLIDFTNFATSLHKVTTTVGDKQRLACNLKPDFGGRIVWRSGNRVLFAGDLRIRRDSRLMLAEGDLVIDGVVSRDDGQYSCEMETDTGKLETDITRLTVLSLPHVKVIGGGGALTIRQGASLSLTCEGKGVPRPVVSWLVKKKTVVTGLGEAILELSDVGHDDAGEVTCFVENVVGTAEEIVKLNILGTLLVHLLN